MKHQLQCAAALAALIVSASIAQSTAALPPKDVSVCELLRKPSAFNGTLIRVRGMIKSGFESFVLSDEDCAEAIWVDDADDENVQPRPKFKVLRDARFAEFERVIRENYRARVVIVGRFDGVDAVQEWTESRKIKGGAVVGFHSNGFGHMGKYRARIVLKQVNEVNSP